MLTLTQRLPPNPDAVVKWVLPLTAAERSRSHYRFEVAGEVLHLRLPRGTGLQEGDLLGSESGSPLVRVQAKPEPVITVTAATALDLLRAAYHLGNRHVPVEIAATYLRLSPDSVLQAMLEQMGMQVTQDILPFQPEVGAYHSH